MPMRSSSRWRDCALFLFIFFTFSTLHIHVTALKKSYVVYMGGHTHRKDEITLAKEEMIISSHHDLLQSVVGSEAKAKEAIFYSYTKCINGFAANLEVEEAVAISKYPGVLSVFENKGRKLHTTHSWDFMHLERNGKVPSRSLWSKARFGEGVIIGNLDTGVWGEAQSFSDEGMGLIPSKWKGTCQESDMGAPGVKCNKKLIGARYFNSGLASMVTEKLDASYYSPRDIDGHGTHTLSTAGGSPVPSASVFGYGKGTARGGSPAARVAAYRVCFTPIDGLECVDADILAAFDAAIADGVDVLSVSLGGGTPDYFKDGIAIGAFHAVQNGVVVVASAGNSGPVYGSVTNVAPWFITVGASTVDREFPSQVVLGNGVKITGQSLSQNVLEQKPYPLIDGANAALPKTFSGDAMRCLANSLDPHKVAGKIVVCERGTNARVAKGESVLLAGGAGMVLVNDEDSDDVMADPHVLPATHVTYRDSLAIYQYMNTTNNPTAYITKPTTLIGVAPAPVMAGFSSQGPSDLNPEILKPDITAPGVSVIAAFTGATSPSTMPFDKRRVEFNSESGTSMSCPHVAGIAGLLKTAHPDWSPAAIKSAIMTTARIRDNTGYAMLNVSHGKATPFAYGSGHVLPNRAMDPGLVYDISLTDYLDFLCSQGYSSDDLKTFTNASYNCPSKTVPPSNLNIPSISVIDLAGRAVVTRRVKNVGDGPANYAVTVAPPRGVKVEVVPTSLTFETVGEEKEFEVRMKVDGDRMVESEYVFGRLLWSDGVHRVTSPLVVRCTL